MKIGTRVRLLIHSLVALICVVLPLSAHAFTVSPALVDVSEDPGSISHGTIHLLNDTAQDQTYYVSVQNFVPQGEEGNQTFLPAGDRSGLAGWITPDQSSIKIGAGSAVDFRWTLNVPADATPGGHYAAVFFSTQPANSSVGIGAKTGVLMLVSVTGKVTEAATVESFHVVPMTNVSQTESATWITSLPALFELRLANTGNTHIQPEGLIVVRDVFGREVAQVPVNPDKSRVLPQSIRDIRSSWGSTSGVGEGFLTKLAAEWHGFAIGRYTATLSADFGRTHTPLAGSVSFWVLPWHILLVVFGGLLALVVLIKAYNRLVVKSAVRRVSQK